MRLPDPYVNIAAPGFNSAKLGDVDPYLTDPMSNGTLLRTKVASQYWTLSLTYPDLTEDEYRILASALAEAKRTSSTIDVLLPQYEQFHVQGDASTATVTDGASGSTVVITNISGLTGTPRVGSLFKLSNHSKVYKMTAVDTQTPGQWTISVFPPLATTTNAATPVFNSVLFEMTLESDSLPLEDPSVDGFYRGVTISLREQVNGG